MLQRDNDSETLFAIRIVQNACYIFWPIFNLKFYHLMPSSVINCHRVFFISAYSLTKKLSFCIFFFTSSLYVLYVLLSFLFCLIVYFSMIACFHITLFSNNFAPIGSLSLFMKPIALFLSPRWQESEREREREKASEKRMRDSKRKSRPILS